MTFAKAIKILDLLDHDKVIVVKTKDDSDGCNCFNTVDIFSKYDEISDYIKYFTDKEHDYHFYIIEDDDSCSDEEIKDY
jgi:hypothetical protein